MSTSPKPSPPPRPSKQTNNRERLPDQNRAADGTVPPELNPQPALATAAGSPATGTAVTTQTTTPKSVGQGMSTTPWSTNAGAAGGKTSVQSDVSGGMAAASLVAWNNVMFEIYHQDQPPVTFDATTDIPPPAVLQFALTSKEQKDISSQKLTKKKICFHAEKNSIKFTLETQLEKYRDGDDLKQYLIESIKTEVLDVIQHVTFRKDEGLHFLETIKKTELSEFLGCKILVYVNDKDMFFVGSKENFSEFSRKFLHRQNPSEAASMEYGNVELQATLRPPDDEVDCLINLGLIGYIEKTFPNVKISTSKSHVTISGTRKSVTNAEGALYSLLTSVVKREVVFKDAMCAKAFFYNSIKNEALCDYVLLQIPKHQNLSISKCHIKVEAGEQPKVFVCCMNEKEADEAARIVSECLCLTRLSNDIFQRIKDELDTLNFKNKFFLFKHKDELISAVSTNDVAKILHHLVTENMDIVKTLNVPALVFRYFTKYGSFLLKALVSEYQVSLDIAPGLFTLTGLPRNIKKAKTYMKENYILQHIRGIDYTLNDIQKSQLDKVAEKYRCCWSSVPFNSDRTCRLKDVQPLVTWHNPQTNAKLTVIEEGTTAKVEFDVLLVFVTDSLFPIISMKHLEKGFVKMLDYSKRVLSGGNKEMIGLGEVRLYPRDLMEDVCRSKEVMYLVVQKSTQTEGFNNLPLPPDLNKEIRKASLKSEVATVGIPTGTDFLDETCTESAQCEQIAREWIKHWSKHKNMPEIFICLKSSAENVLEAFERCFWQSKGFSKHTGTFTSVEDVRTASQDPVKVEVKIGDLLNSKVEVIVNTTAQNLDLSKGLISSKILKLAGNSVQEECAKNYKYGIEHGEVAVTGPGNLRHATGLLHILHSSLPIYKLIMHYEAIDYVKKVVKNCLYTAERLNARTIAFPALGTGKLEYPRRDVATAMFDGVEEYNKEAVNKGLKHIYFILFEGDKQVCEAFRSEEWRRNDPRYNSKRYSREPSEMCMKKEVTLGSAPLEFSVRMNVDFLPPQFVEVIFKECETAVQASLTFEQASSFPPSWNDKMIFTSNIIDDSFFRKIVKIIVEKTVEYKITGIVFYPLTESSYRFSVGEQIKKFTEQVEALGSSGRKYLRVIWFVVDESGISSAENCLLSVPTRSLMTLFSIAGNSSWEKTSQSKTADKISLNVIGPDKTAVDSFLAEMKSILSQPQHTSQEPPSLQTSTIQSVGYLTPLTNEIRQHSGKLKEGPDLDLENGTPVDDLSTQNYEVQGARPKQGRMGPGQPAGISEPNSTVTEIQALKEEDSLIFDTIMVTANINQGILSFLKEKGDNYFHDWIKQLGKVFKVALVSDAEKVSINGSLMHVKALCNYLNTAFPKNPEEVDYKADESDSKEDSVECDGVLVTTSSKNYVVYQYLMDKVLLSVYLGDLTQVNVDCIVSTATPNLKGALGLEKNVLESAGADVLTACDIYRQKIKTLQPGESLITTGGKLRCKKIIHFAFPFKGSSSNQQELEAAFTSCFRNVENEGLLSVAISGVGSVLTKEHECVVQSLHRAVETLNTRRYSTVQHIHFVDKKTRLLKLVMDAFISNFSCLQINKATIYIVKGDITSLKADALVVFQDSDFSMSSNIAKKIACVSGDHYSLDLNDLKLMNSRPGNILVKKSRGDLATVCGYLLHAVVLQSKGDEKEKKVTTVEVFQDTLDKIMATCKENNIITLGVPVFDVRELNVKKFFQAMAEFMFEYFCTNDTNIKAVHFMSEDETSVRTFIHCLHKQIDNADKFKKKGKPLSLRNRRP